MVLICSKRVGKSGSQVGFPNIPGHEMSLVKPFWAIPVPNTTGEAQGTIWNWFWGLTSREKLENFDFGGLGGSWV